jgi:2-amino-4-hydroxy-6-hydroxymethyldihydropteridine diphosphokinase
VFPVAIALGSNLGDRHAHLGWALGELSSFVAHLRVSSIYETEPAEVPDPQPQYLNAVAVGETALAPREVLERLLDIEARRGRERSSFHAARTLDLDLVLYGDRVIDETGLAVPHPRFRDRLFVLEPLAEVAGRWADPVTGKTVAQMRDAARRKSGQD